MNKGYKKDILKARIAALRIERDHGLISLKEEFGQTIDSFRPGNIIKRAFAKVTDSHTVLDSVTGIVIGLISGYLVKKTLFKKSNSTMMNMVAMLVQTFVTNAATNNSDEIKSKGGELIQSIIETATMLYKKYKAYREEVEEEDENLEEEVIAQT